MEIKPIAFFRSPFQEKFGIPRQSGLVEELEGEIVLEPEWRQREALRGLEDFDYIWLLWGFSEHVEAKKSSTVRPPLLGGNQRMGVFATRSPFRPNNIGLSSVRIIAIEESGQEGPVIRVQGADLMDGTPIYDIKPYLPYVDSHADARSGFVGDHAWKMLKVSIPSSVRELFSPRQLVALEKVLALNPRPQYQENPEKVYGMTFSGIEVRFRIDGDTLTVLG